MLLTLVATSAQASVTPVTGPARTAAGGPAGTLAQDPARGVPSLWWSPTPVAARPGMSPEDAARWHLDRQRKVHGNSRAAVAGARLRFVHDNGRGGIIVALRQRVGGVDVLHGDIKVLLDASHRLLAISGAPHPAARPASARPFVQGPALAAATALADLQPAAAGARFVDTGVTRAGWRYFELASPGARLRRPARVQPVYFPAGDALLPAHAVELQVLGRDGALTAYQYVVAADDGRVLERRDLVDHAAFTYRVHADTTGDRRPYDGPLVDYSPHPTGTPTGGPKLQVPANLITMEGFNTNPDLQPDPWLAPDATFTRGNNVDAYVDHTNPDGYQPELKDFRAEVTAPGVFDWSYDTALEPLAIKSQSMAAITQIFYTTNWMHDWWYDSGFDEAAGNAQLDNYGRGGAGNDPLHAEAQDAALVGTRNNANMFTPNDGESPRMQMYLWTPLVQTTLTVTPLDQSFSVATASFGPKNYDVTAPLVLMKDAGGASVTDGCDNPVIDLAGKIVLIDRGACTFEFKAAKAQAAGAVGVLIANNVDGALNMGLDNNVVDPTIPSQSVLKVDGATLKAALANAPQSAHMVGSATPERDGTIDNMIVAHEWGHFIHHRLVDCGANQCRAQSEGWGDWNALMMTLRDGDDLHATYGACVYATFDPTGYFGIRRVPYSVNTDKNALSLRHIADGEALPVNHPLGGGGPNSEVHNAGEVWATQMFEAYIALHEAHADLPFEEVHRMMGDYVVAGMMLTPTDPTYTEQRDAILMAIHAADPADALTVAAAFAKRGSGSCAVSPPRDSTDFKGVIEDFELRASGAIGAVTLTDDVLTCDSDGIVDVGELGTLKIEVFNHGAVEMPAGTTVEILDPDPALVLADGPLFDLPAVPAFTGTIAELPVALDPTTVDHLARTLNIRLTTPDGCTETVETFLRADFNGDIDPDSADVDDFEADTPGWTRGGTEEGDAVWRQVATPTGHVYHGDDVGRLSDTWLATPTLSVSADQPLVLSWDHAYSFEFSDGLNWDGGVLELSEDDGVTWQDLSAYTPNPGYTSEITSAANPLYKRPAFVHQNPSWPASDPYSVDLGLALAGKQVKLRFRIGTDAAAGGPGWDIDNFTAEGIVNTPFSTWIADQTECVLEEDTTGTDSGDSTTGDGTTGDATTGDATSATDATTSTTADATTGSTTADDTTDGVSGTTMNAGTTLELTSGGLTTGGFTTGGVTTGDGTTGVLTSGTGGMNTTDPAPTEGGPGSADESGAADSSGSSGGGGEIVTDDGCGCRVDERDGRGWLWQLAPWLGLAALRRRRRA